MYLESQSLDTGVATVQRALELGFTYFDTTSTYGQLGSQVVVGKAMKGRSELYTLATKIGYFADHAHFQSADAIAAQWGDNLRALRRQRVDVLQLHMVEFECWWKDGSTNQCFDLNAEYDFANAPIIKFLRQAKAEGLCRFIGITSDSADHLARVLWHVDVDLCLLAYGYGLLHRKARRPTWACP